MLNPAGTFSFAVGNLSGAAGIGGGAFGASLAAASLPAGRTINGEPGGSAGAAAAGAPAAGGGAAGCWAAAPSVNAVRKAPDSNRLRGTDEWLIMVFSLRKPFSLRAAHGVPTPVAFRTAISDIFLLMRNWKHASRQLRRPDIPTPTRVIAHQCFVAEAPGASR